MIGSITRRFGSAVTPPVRDTVKIAAPGFHEPITLYAATHPAAEDYRAVTTALVDLIEARS